MPVIPLQPLATLLAASLMFVLCYLWYGPLFGTVWARAVGQSPEQAPAGRRLAAALLGTFATLAVMAFVLSQNIGAWTPANWGLPAQPGARVSQVVSAAVFTWLGFIVPVLAHAMAWDRGGWRLFAINAGYYLCALLIAAGVLVWV